MQNVNKIPLWFEEAVIVTEENIYAINLTTLLIINASQHSFANFM